MGALLLLYTRIAYQVQHTGNRQQQQRERRSRVKILVAWLVPPGSPASCCFCLTPILTAASTLCFLFGRREVPIVVYRAKARTHYTQCSKTRPALRLRRTRKIRTQQVFSQACRRIGPGELSHAKVDTSARLANNQQHVFKEVCAVRCVGC